MKIRLGGSRRKAGALYGIEQIRASGAYAITGGRRSEPHQLRPVNWVELPRCENEQPHTIFFARQAARAKCKKSEVEDTYVCNNCRWRAGACVHRAAAGNHRLFIQSLLERRNKRPAASEVKSKPIGSEHSLARPGAESEAVPSHRPNTLTAGHLPGLATPIVARHHDARTPHSARDHGRAEWRGPISDRHSTASAPASPADRSTQANVRDRRA
jgi:hypothetical protein